MLVEQSILNEVKIIKPEIHIDDRGTFLELFKSSNFKKFGLPHKFVQENQVFSRKGVLRGLHYQLPPYSQGKLVRVISGEVFDIAVDIRKSGIISEHI